MQFNVNKNSYIFIYSTILVVVVAILLAFAATALKATQLKNIKKEKMNNILKSAHIESTLDISPDLFKKYIIDSYLVDENGKKIDREKIDLKIEMKKYFEAKKFPVFVLKNDKGEVKYIFPLIGRGLWDEIWGYMALNDDFNSVSGVVYDHKAETPGLGDGIVQDFYTSRYIGKKLFDQKGQFKSIITVKEGSTKDEFMVDAITGSTKTCKGVEKMILDCMSKYSKFVELNKKPIVSPIVNNN